MATIFSDFLNYDLLYLGNYSTDLNEIWHTYSTYKGLLSEYFRFGKIQYGRHFFSLSDFLNYDLLYLGNYSTDLNEIWHTV